MRKIYISLVLIVLSWVSGMSQSMHSTPDQARELCNKAPVTITTVMTTGSGNPVTPSCFNAGIRQPYWFKFTPITTGGLEFVVIPEFGSADFDFALYQGFPSFGNEVDCNWAAPFLATGMTPDPFSFGVNPNNSILPYPATVFEGQEYYLLVDNYTMNGTGFTIIFGGDVQFADQDIPFFVPDARSCATAPQFDCACIDGFESGTEFFNYGGNIPGFNGTLENPHVYRFTACACVMRFTVTVNGMCRFGDAIEAQVITAGPSGACGGGAITPMTTGGPGLPCTLMAANLNIGQDYMLVIDGEAGASCPYMIETELITPGPLSYQDTIYAVNEVFCEGDTMRFWTGQVFNFNECYWIPPAGFDTLVSPHDTLVAIAGHGDGTPQTLCLHLSNGCGDSVTICRTITIFPDTTIQQALALCAEEFPYDFNGRVISEPGVYIDSLQTAAGCDSVYVLTVTEVEACLFECTPLTNPLMAAADSCSKAPFLCGNYLEGYCSDNFSANDNETWVRFSPCSDTLGIQISVFDCNLDQGLNFALATGTCDTLIPVGGATAIADSSFNTLIWPGLVPDNIYFLQVSGLAGDQCRFKAQVTQGMGTDSPLAGGGGAGFTCDCTPHTISGPNMLCPGQTATFTLIPGSCIIIQDTTGGGMADTLDYCLPPIACSGGILTDTIVPVWHFNTPSIQFQSDSVGYSVTVTADPALVQFDTIINSSVYITWEDPTPGGPGNSGGGGTAQDSLIFCDCVGGSGACLPPGPGPFPFQIKHDIVDDFCVLSCVNIPCFVNGQPYYTPGVFVDNSDPCVTYIVHILDNFNFPFANSSENTICQGESITLDAGPPFSQYVYQWSNGMYGPTITVSPGTTTTYQVIATDQSSGCTSTGSHTVHVVPIKITNIVHQLCPNGPIDVCGTVYSQVGVYSETCIGYSGCDSIVNLTIIPGPLTVVNQGVIGTLSCIEPCILHLGETFCSAGTYQRDIGCERYIFTIMSSFSQPSVAIVPTSTQLCQGQSTTLNVIAPPGATLMWFEPGVSGASPVVTPLVSHLYTVYATSATNGCTGTASALIVVEPYDTLVLGEVAQISCAQPCVVFGGHTYCAVGAYSDTVGCAIRQYSIGFYKDTITYGVVDSLSCSQPCTQYLGQTWCAPGDYEIEDNCSVHRFTISFDPDLPSDTLPLISICAGECVTVFGQNICYDTLLTQVSNCTLLVQEIEISPFSTINMGTVGVISCTQPCLNYLNQNYCASGQYADTTGCIITLFDILFELDTIEHGVVDTLTCQQPCAQFLGQTYCNAGDFVFEDNCTVQYFTMLNDPALPSDTLPILSICENECVTVFGVEICQDTTVTSVSNCTLLVQPVSVTPFAVVQLDTVGWVSCMQPCYDYSGTTYCAPGAYADTSGCTITTFSIAFRKDTLQHGVVDTITCAQTCVEYLGQILCIPGDYTVEDSCTVHFFTVVENLSEPACSAPQYECLPSNTYYTVSFNISGQPPYKVNSVPVSGSFYASAPQQSGAAYVFIVEQVSNGCQTVLDGEYDCALMCVNSAGELSAAMQTVCENQAATAVEVQAAVVTSGDIIEYALHTLPGSAGLGDVLAMNTTGSFVYNAASMNLGEIYYIARLTGPAAPDGHVDMNNGCAKMSNGQPIRFVALPNVSIAGETAVCAGEPLMLAAQGGDQYTWSDGTIGSNLNYATTTTLQSGQYAVTAVDANGCAATASISIQVSSGPQSLDLIAISPLCPGENNGSIEIVQVNGGFSPYVFTFDQNASGSVPATLADLVAGAYALEITDAWGCAFDTLLTLDDPAPLSLELGADFDTIPGQQILLTPSANFVPAQIQWVSDQGASSGELQWTVKPYATTTYACTLTDANGCTVEDRITITIKAGGELVYPNVIDVGGSQNIDNEYFTIFAQPGWILEIKQMSIYDRWGEQVWTRAHFPANAPTEGWHGTVKGGKRGDPGVYVFVAQVLLADGTERMIRGDVTLLR